MIDRYLEYLSTVRRYSPRTVEIYRSVLEEYQRFTDCTDCTEISVQSVRSYEVYLMDVR